MQKINVQAIYLMQCSYCLLVNSYRKWRNFNVVAKRISQLTNLCTGIRSWPPPISSHPFRCSLGAFFYGTRFIWSTMYRSTLPLRFIWL